MKKTEDRSKISDGYYTFEELYEHRNRLFITLCKKVRNFPVWISKRHHDGSESDGWFIMGIGSSKGLQISYHLPIKLWEECKDHFEYHDHAPFQWDGHSPNDVIKRLEKWGSIL